MTCLQMTNVERAQMAMMLEVCAYPKPGNVDRCHDYPETRLEHFLASTILARPALEEADRGTGRIGEIIKHAVRDTNCHEGGNTHFGAFILLIPLRKLIPQTCSGASGNLSEANGILISAVHPSVPIVEATSQIMSQSSLNSS